jgi:hypothetical protein
MDKKHMFALYRIFHLKLAPLVLRYQERLLLRLVFGRLNVGNETVVNQYIFCAFYYVQVK